VSHFSAAFAGLTVVTDRQITIHRSRLHLAGAVMFSAYDTGIKGALLLLSQAQQL